MKNRIYYLFLLVLMVLSCRREDVPGEQYPDGIYAEIISGKGIITVYLEAEKAPLSVMNFVGLSEGLLPFDSGKKRKSIYENIIFNSVIEGTIATAGPLPDGTEGPGYFIPDEFHTELNHHGEGILSYVSDGIDRNGGRFLMTMRSLPELDGRYTVFGRVVSGMQILKEVEEGDIIKEIKIKRIGKKYSNYRVNKDDFSNLYASAVSKSAQLRSEMDKKILAGIKKQIPDLIITDSGLAYKILKEGEGGRPVKDDNVKVLFKAMLLDGTVIDSSAMRGSISNFILGRGIEGWNQTLPQMKKGEIRFIAVPPDLAYGKTGFGKTIPPDSFLIFEIELVDF